MLTQQEEAHRRKVQRQQTINRIVEQGISSVNAKEIIESVISGMGGPQSFAAEMIIDFRENKERPHIRARLWAIFGDLLKFTTQHFPQDDGLPDDPEQLRAALRSIADKEPD